MNHWFIFVQLSVGGLGALLFLSALADAFVHEEHLFGIRKRRREIELMDGEGDEAIIQVDPQPEAITIPPSS